MSENIINGTTILIREEKGNSFMGSGSDMMGEFDLFGGIQNVENELSVLSSFTIINQAIQELNLEVTYILEENLFPLKFLPFKSYTDLYDNSPIQVIIDQTHSQPVNVRFYVEIINDSTFKLKVQGEKWNYLTTFLINLLAILIHLIFLVYIGLEKKFQVNISILSFIKMKILIQFLIRIKSFFLFSMIFYNLPANIKEV